MNFVDMMYAKKLSSSPNTNMIQHIEKHHKGRKSLRAHGCKTHTHSMYKERPGK